jgi:hypothetical protein
MELNKNRICYVCGYILEDNIKKFEICDCCLFQFGIDENSYPKNSILTYRKNWLKEGLPFAGELIESANWNLTVISKQLENLKFLVVEEYPLKGVIDKNNEWFSDINFELLRKWWNEYESQRISK